MKIIDSSDPEQMETEKKGISWHELWENKYTILALIPYLYFITHLNEVRSFFKSAFFEVIYQLQESWDIWLILVCISCLAVYCLMKTIQFLKFVMRFFVLLFKALEKYTNN